MTAPAVPAIHAELDRARAEFHALVHELSPARLAQPSNGTRWTNRELLFHMLFGYLVTRNLLFLVKVVTRLPFSARRAFAGLLNAGTRPFHHVNYWGSRAAGRVLTPDRMQRWMDRVIASLHRHLDRESARSLARHMPFPTRWDPFFTDHMTVADVYHYATLHFDFHREQLS